MPRSKRGKQDNKQPARAYGVIFADHLTGMDAGGPLYKSVRQAVDLCDSALRNVKRRSALSDKLYECEKKLGELSYIGRMTDSEITHFKSLLEHFMSLSQERSGLLAGLSRFDQSLPVLERVGRQAGEALPEMREAEAYHSALRHDIGYLEGEKEDLRFERGVLSAGIRFISKFSVGLTFLFVFAAVLLCYLALVQGADVFMYSAALIFLSVSAGTLIYFFRKRVSVELSLNQKKRQKAVHVLNQKNTVYAFYSNFLNYCYDKYHVRSAAMLQTRLKDCEDYKKATKRIDSVRGIMYQTQREIEDFMREKKIDQDRASMEGFARTWDAESQKHIYQSLLSAKNKAEKQLTELEKRHEAIWSLLTRLQADRPAAGELIENVIQTYLDEA